MQSKQGTSECINPQVPALELLGRWEGRGEVKKKKVVERTGKKGKLMGREVNYPLGTVGTGQAYPPSQLPWAPAFSGSASGRLVWFPNLKQPD